MRHFMRRWLNLDQYDGLTYSRAELIVWLTVAAMALFSVYALFAPDWHSTTPNVEDTALAWAALFYRSELLPLLVTPYIMGFIALFSIYKGRLRTSGLVVSLMVYTFSVLPVLLLASVDFYNSGYLVNIFLFLFATGLLNGQIGLLVAFIVSLVTFLLDAGNAPASFVITFIAQLVGGVIVGALYLRIAVLSRSEGVAEATVERIKLAEITTRLTQLASQRLALKEALDVAVELILANYPQFYHVQVFLNDQNNVNARLVASSGEVGEKLLARHHSLAVGSVSVIGQTTWQNTPIIAYTDDPDAIYRPNDLLPETLLEIAFPLRIGDNVIGALDLQSKTRLTLSDEDLSSFQSLADSLALVMDNIRQFELSRQRVEENERLAEQARIALQEVQRLNKRLIGRAWSDYLREQREATAVDIDLVTREIVEDNTWTETLEEAVRANTVVVDKGVVAVPLRVRGQIIGAMEFEVSSDTITQEDYALLQELSDRFGAAAENTRLVEQSQRVAQREALINVVSSRLQAMNNVEATLAETARSLSELIGAERVVIRLGRPQPNPTRSLKQAGD